MDSRPSVDVVVPFRGSTESLEQLMGRLARLSLRPGDSVLVVDNTPGREGSGVTDDDVSVLHAADRPTPAYARNQGAARGNADWLVFLDADTEPRPDLLDRYFDPPPAERTGLIGGGVVDKTAPADASLVARYAYLRQRMSQEDTFSSFGEWGYPKTANVACRRAAFDAVGGFRQEIRAAEDADLTYRLRAAGWEVERREDASVVHASRKTLREFVVQKALWGAGGEWVARRYPGAVPMIGGVGVARWAARMIVEGLVTAVRTRDRDAAIIAVFRPIEALAWEFGRLLPNERPVPDSSIWKRLGLLR